MFVYSRNLLDVFGSVLGKYFMGALFAILSQQDRLMAAKNVALDCGAIQLGQTLKLPARLAMLVPPQKQQDRSWQRSNGSTGSH